MSEPICRPLIEVLAEVPDFRKSQGRRHALCAILALACAAILCGYQSYGAMAEWGRHYGTDLAARLGFQEGKTPSVGTLHTIFRYLDKQALETKLQEWAETMLAQMPASSQALAIDGKSLRGSQKQGACDVHLLSAVSHGLGLTVCQKAVAEKTNEIGAVETVLAALVLEGRIVTVDALLTQKQVAQSILSKGGSS
jgi:hypothetical protein